MSESDSLQLSDEEKRFLHYEMLITKAIEARNPSGTDSSKSIWLQVLESKAVATLITVIIGGIIGQIIIASIQDNINRNNRSLTEYKQYLDRQDEVVQHVYDLIGKCIFDAQNLISLTQPSFELEGISPEEREIVRKQKQDVIINHNKIAEEWQRDKNKTGLLMSYYHYGQADVLPAWRDTQEAVDKLLGCSLNVYKNYLNNPEATKNRTDMCNPEKQEVKAKLDKLAAVIEKSRRYIWQELSVPSK